MGRCCRQLRRPDWGRAEEEEQAGSGDKVPLCFCDVTRQGADAAVLLAESQVTALHCPQGMDPAALHSRSPSLSGHSGAENPVEETGLGAQT